MQVIKLNHTPTIQALNQVVAVLKQGGLVIYPTETVYGAGVDATNPQAVAKLLNYKSRREGQPLSIAVANQAMAEKYVTLNNQAKDIYRKFLPGPVTVVSQQRTNSSDNNLASLAPGVASEFGTVGVRIPDYPFILELLTKYGRPVTATSANASGKKRPYSVNDILNNLSKKQQGLLDLIVDVGKLPPNPPSTVIDTTAATPITFRAGKLADQLGLDQASSWQIKSDSEWETQEIAGKLLLKYWKQIKQTGLIIGLNGPLGAGKTVFTKGVARFLQLGEVITSPTYTYLNEYDYQRHGVNGKLFHLDMWKVNSAEAVARLELDELLTPHQVVVVEWWSQVQDWLPQSWQQALIVNITPVDECQRQLTIYEPRVKKDN